MFGFLRLGYPLLLGFAVLGCGGLAERSTPEATGGNLGVADDASAAPAELIVIEPTREHRRAAAAGGEPGIETMLMAVSDDATQGLGVSRWSDGTSNHGEELTRWSREGGSVGLGQLRKECVYAPGGINSSMTAMTGYCRVEARSIPFRWTEPTGMQELPLPFATSTINGSFISDDGVVTLLDVVTEHGSRAIRHVRGGDALDLGVPPGYVAVSPRYLSPDGQAVYGVATSSDCAGACSPTEVAFRWTEQAGLEVLYDPAGAKDCRVTFVTARPSGVVIGADCALGDGRRAPFIWGNVSGWVAFGGPPGFQVSEVSYVASDLSSAWGYSSEGTATALRRVWRWTAEAGAQPLTPPASFAQLVFTSFTDDAALGQARVDYRERAIHWSVASGFRVLEPLDGDARTEAIAMSADGRRVLGSSFEYGQSAPSRPVLWLDGAPLALLDLLGTGHDPSPGVPWITTRLNQRGSLVEGVLLTDHGWLSWILHVR